MKRFPIAAAILIALVAVPAYAQHRGPKTTRTDEQQKTDAEIDKAYQRALQASRNKGPSAPIDPWGKVRPPAVGSDKR